MSPFRISAEMPSRPGAFPFFISRHLEGGPGGPSAHNRDPLPP